MRKKKGFTLVELLIAIALIGIGIMALAESFKYIQRGIQLSKNRSIASNLAQEKMQIIKEKSYYNIAPTTAPLYLNDFSPAIPYDNSFFPPEIILEAGVTYTRYSYIQNIQEDSGNLVTISPTAPDTGMRQITVTAVWNEGGTRKNFQVKSIITNTNTVMANCVFNGTVRNASTFAPIQNAVVNMAENVGYRDTTGSSGAYNISVVPGNYTMYVSAKGYFPAFKQVSITANQTQTNNFDLVQMASGTVIGYPWLRDHLVISQIVGSTINSSGWDQEYVEIFNPTTYTWTVNGNIGLKYQRIYDTVKKNIQINYFIASIAPGGFYLFANTGTVIAAGYSRNADAVWSDSNNISDFPDFANQKNIIRVFDEGGDEGGGALELYRISDSAVLDQVGWNRNDGASGKKTAPFYETNAIAQTIGLQRNELYARYSSTSGISSSYGPSYDSNNNNADFYDYSSSVSLPPRNSSFNLPVIAATPADGAIASCSDGLSSPVSASLSGTPPYAFFQLTDVATGTWSCMITSNSYTVTYDTVSITSSGSTFIFGSTWTFLDSQAISAYITGRVLNSNNNPISPQIKVTNYSSDAWARTSDGRYILTVSGGYTNVVANPGSYNSSYVSVTSENVHVNLGEIRGGVDFILYPGGRISGFVTRDGSNPLPGIAIAINDFNGLAKDVQISGTDGRFISNNLSTGTYYVEPSIDPKETVTPSSTTVNIVSAGTTYFSSTFTVKNAMGYVKGSVSYQGNPVKTGALIVVSTVTIASLPNISTASLSGAPYYMTSSNEEGIYTAEVRQSTNPAYRVYAFYPAENGNTYTLLSSTITNVPVLAGQTTTGVNFSW
ncbi:MAG: carboxypeptidase regulatory-like domain-containing protein [Elusimicrobiota bacterium]